MNGLNSKTLRCRACIAWRSKRLCGWGGSMATLLQDLRYALRQLRKSPGFAFTVVLTLALSVGVATAVFCVIDNVILRPLPYLHPERIVSVDSRSHSGYTQPAS